jgi:hypothetical protein
MDSERRIIPLGGICQGVDTTRADMALTATSLIAMPFLGIAADTLGSYATYGEDAQKLLCAYLAGAVFLGLGGNTMLGWWRLAPSRPC